MKRALWVTGAALALAAAGWGGWRYFTREDGGRSYRLAAVDRGEIVQTVRATGLVQPIRLVDVGTQVNGPVQKLYVDYNDRVKEGDLVAQIDPTVYQARLAQDTANLAQAQAAVDEARARLVQADKDLARSRKLAEREMVSQADLDAAVANRDTLAAQLKVAEAAVEQAQAALRLSKANLGYTTIRSPVNGVVVNRNVSEGQTVVASMTAQVLFEIATDLGQVQVQASIPEADIGRVRTGQPVTFTVDAHDRTFTGTVAQIRLAAATVQNVVTYPVIISADNPDGLLFPGMTATLVCETARRANALRVPNAALRFKPAETPANGEKTAATGPAGGGPRGSGHAERRGGGHGARVWVPAPGDGTPQPVRIRTGITDGSFTELQEPVELAEGQPVIVGQAPSGDADQKVVNPFTPQMPRGGGRPPRM